MDAETDTLAEKLHTLEGDLPWMYAEAGSVKCFTKAPRFLPRSCLFRLAVSYCQHPMISFCRHVGTLYFRHRKKWEVSPRKGDAHVESMFRSSEAKDPESAENCVRVPSLGAPEEVDAWALNFYPKAQGPAPPRHGVGARDLGFVGFGL